MRLNNACKYLFALGGVHIGSPPPTLRPLGFSFLMEEGGGSSGSNNNRIGQPKEGEDESSVDDGDGSLSESEEVPPLFSDLSNFTWKTEQGEDYKDENGRIYYSIGHAWIGQLTYVNGQHVEIVGVNEDTGSVPTEYRFLVKCTSDGTLQSHIKSSFTADFDKAKQHWGHYPSDREKTYQTPVKKDTTEYNNLTDISLDHVLLSRDKTNLLKKTNLQDTKNLKDDIRTRLIGFIIDGQVVRTCSMHTDNLHAFLVHGLRIEIGRNGKSKDNLTNILIGAKDIALRGGDSKEVSASKKQARFNQIVKEALTYTTDQDEDWDGRFSSVYKFNDGTIAYWWQTRLCRGDFERRLSPEVKVQLTDSGLVWSRVQASCSVDDIEDFSLDNLLVGSPSSSFRLFLPFIVKQLGKKLNKSPSDPYFYSHVVGFGVPRSDVDQDQVTNTNDVADLLSGINVEDGDDEDDDNQGEGTQVIGDVMIPTEIISRKTLHTVMVRNGWTQKTVYSNLTKRELIDELITMKTLLDSDPAAYERKVEANRSGVEANRTNQPTGRGASSTMTIDEVKQWLLEYRKKTGMTTLAFPTSTRDPEHKYVSRKVNKALKQIRAGVELQNEMICMLNDIKWNTNPQSRHQEQFRIESRVHDYFMRKSVEGVQPFDSISLGNNDTRFSNHALFRPDFTYVICHRTANGDVENFIVFIECDEHRHDGYWRLQEHRKMTFLMLASAGKDVHNILWLRFNSAEYTDPQPNQMENIAAVLQTWNNGIDTNPEDRRGCYLKIMDYPEDHPIIQEYKDREITGDSSPRPEDWEIDEHCTREMFVSVELTNKSERFVCGW